MSLSTKPLAVIQAYGVPLAVKAQHYNHGMRLALTLERLDNGAPYGVFTVNIPDAPLGADEILVKTWEENTPMRQPMLDTGLFEDTGRRVPAGFCQAEVWRLTKSLNI